MASLPTGHGYTPAQWEAWFAANATPGNPTYTGSAKAGTVALAGKSWSAVYAALYAEGKTTPDATATATEELALEEAVGLGLGAAATTAGQAIGAAGTGVSTASYVPSWASGLTGFLSQITTAALWVRVAKVIVGGVLVVVGLSHMTGASNAVATAARKVPVIV